MQTLSILTWSQDTGTFEYQQLRDNVIDRDIQLINFYLSVGIQARIKMIEKGNNDG